MEAGVKCDCITLTFILFVYFEGRSHDVAQADLNLKIL